MGRCWWWKKIIYMEDKQGRKFMRMNNMESNDVHDEKRWIMMNDYNSLLISIDTERHYIRKYVSLCIILFSVSLFNHLLPLSSFLLLPFLSSSSSSLFLFRRWCLFLIYSLIHLSSSSFSFYSFYFHSTRYCTSLSISYHPLLFVIFPLSEKRGVDDERKMTENCLFPWQSLSSHFHTLDYSFPLVCG